jgi:hypothetical protein
VAAGKLSELGAAGESILELLCTIIEELGAADPATEEPATAVKLSGELVGLALGDTGPGRLNPGIPVEFPAAALLVAMRVEGPSGDSDTLSWGVYVKDGTVVKALSGPLSAAAFELAGGAGLAMLEERTGLIFEGRMAWLEDGEGIGDALDVTGADEEAGSAGVGVKYDVIKTVSAPCEAIGSPLGLRKVIAGLTRVRTVFCMGSMTSAVSALTRSEDDGWRLDADCFEMLSVLIPGADVGVEDEPADEEDACRTWLVEATVVVVFE